MKLKTTAFTTASLITALLGWAALPTLSHAADPPVDAQPQQEEQSKQVPEQQDIAQTTFLGVDTAAIQPQLRRELGLDPGTALVIRHVGPGTPAEEAGLLPGDVLVRLNDQLLINSEQFAVLVRTFKPGQAVTLHVLRDGQPVELNATLGGRVVPQRQIERGPMPELQPMPRLGDLDALFEQLRGQGLDPFPPGGDLRDMFDQMQRRMFEQRDEMQRMMDQMRDRIGEHDMQSSVSINDGEHVLQLRSNGNGKHLTLKTLAGEVLYDGPVPEDGQIEGLPEHLQHKVDNLLKHNRIEFRMPKPAPQKREPLPVA